MKTTRPTVGKKVPAWSGLESDSRSGKFEFGRIEVQIVQMTARGRAVSKVRTFHAWFLWNLIASDNGWIMRIR